MPGSGLTLPTPEQRVDVGGTPGLLAYAMDALFEADPLLPKRAVVLPGGGDVPGPAPVEDDDGAPPPPPLSSCFHLDSHGKVRSRVLLHARGWCGERRPAATTPRVALCLGAAQVCFTAAEAQAACARLEQLGLPEVAASRLAHTKWQLPQLRTTTSHHFWCALLAWRFLATDATCGARRGSSGANAPALCCLVAAATRTSTARWT